ncbi:P-loop containing nucleoside triphosphate hydrolase protein [Ceratobasidium sp. AG-I]|nr:P-loop containing nucleoside triphosphate hydrolase protein [Ceratobasidium sp. AG-I]
MSEMRRTLANYKISSRIFENHSASRFMTSSPTPESLPRESLAEVIFIGRANVGKSSLLNAVLGRTSLVKTSAKPGHTRALNFFQVGSDAGKLTLVDAPGYGGRGRPEWGKVFEHYVSTRQSLKRVFLLINAKHGFSATDEVMLRDSDTRFKDTAGLSFSYQLVLTKMDSVPISQYVSIKNEVAQRAWNITRTMSPDVVPTSAVHRGEGLGIDELREVIVQACN